MQKRLSIVPHVVAKLSADENTMLDRLAADLSREEPGLSGAQWFAPLVGSGMGEGPWAVLSDHRDIALAVEDYAALCEYRLAMLARDGDRVILSTPPHKEFESYRRSILGLGALVSLQVGTSAGSLRGSLAARCLDDASILDHLSQLASRAGELTILPYLASGHTWLLARQIAQQAGTHVNVAAPHPQLARRVNDKVWFSRIVERLLGPRALPRALGVGSATAMAARVREIARRSSRVVIKVPDSAGSTGNFVFPSTRFRAASLKEIRDLLIAKLREAGWNARYPLIVQVWEEDISSSPSVQIWVPDRFNGPPVVEGIFEQIVEGEKGTFAGARGGNLPIETHDRLVHESSLIAGLFQRLGYYGRMSLDCILQKRRVHGPAVHWVECNGRWGAVSIPMTLVNRLTSDWNKHPFVVAQRTSLKLPPRSFSRVLELLSDLLFREGGDPCGLVLLGPGAFELGLGYQLVAIASHEDGAKRLVETAIARLSSDQGEV